MNYVSSQRLLRRQGLQAKSVAVQKKFIKKWAIWLLLITVLALFYVWSRVQMVQVGYQVTELKQEAEGLSKQVSGLELDIEKLKSPDRLESFAKEKLLMQPPSAEQTVLVRPVVK